MAKVPEIDSPAVAYLVICVIVTFALSITDQTMIGFGILLLLLFVFAASLDKGSSDANLKALNWTNLNFSLALITGVMGGLIALLVGSMILDYDKRTASILVPDFYFAASLAGVTVASVSLATTFNVLAQWFTVAPAEEAMARILGVRAGMSIFRTTSIAYIFGSSLWIIMHIPTYTAQNAQSEMYIVLAFLALVAIGLLYLTKNIFSAIIAHATFNTGVIMLAANGEMFLTGSIIVIILSFIYYMTPKPKARSSI